MEGHNFLGKKKKKGEKPGNRSPDKVCHSLKWLRIPLPPNSSYLIPILLRELGSQGARSMMQGMHPSPLTKSLHGLSLGLLPVGGVTTHTGARETLSCCYFCQYPKGSPSVPLSLEQLVELRLQNLSHIFQFSLNFTFVCTTFKKKHKQAINNTNDNGCSSTRWFGYVYGSPWFNLHTSELVRFTTGTVDHLYVHLYLDSLCIIVIWIKLIF